MPSDTSFSRAGQPGAVPQPPEPVAEEPRTTETTLTTRIRINIPGSRPIPPVVVRSPIAGGEGAEEQPEAREAAAPEMPTRRRHRSDTLGSPVLGVMEGSHSTAPPPDLPPEWQTGAPTAAAAAPAPAPAPAPEAEAESTPEGGSTWFAPRKKSRPAGAPSAAPAASAQVPAPAPAPFQPEPQQQPVYQPEQTYETPLPPQPYEQQQSYEQQPFEQQQLPDNTMQLFLPPEPEAQQPFAQPFDERFEAQFAPQQPYDPAGNFPQQQGGAPAAGRRSGPAAGFNGGLTAAAASATVQQQPTQSPAPENEFEATAPIPVLPKPQNGKQQGGKKQPGKQPGGKQRGPQEQRPAAAPSVPDGYAGGTGGAGAPPRRPSDPETAAAPAASATAKPAKKRGRGRKLVVTGIGVLVLAAAVAYGAGLMLNQADVPRGTTVLGYGIGGDTSDTAVDTLNNTVGKIATAPLMLSVDGKPVSLNPTAAGLTIDTTATVASVAKKSYNPVTVVESLLGGVHAVDPVVVIDPDKLRYALQQLSTGSGSSHEGSVHFDDDGKVVTVLPQSGQTLDVDQAVNLVRQAYQARAEGAPNTTVVLPMTTAAPKVSAAAVQSAASTIGAWAMKQHFYVTVKGSSPVPFGPHTFSQALSLQPGPNGTLVPVFDLAKLQNAYGPEFAGETVLHNGVAGPVTAQDVASALVQLLSKPGGPTSITIQ